LQFAFLERFQRPWDVDSGRFCFPGRLVARELARDLRSAQCGSLFSGGMLMAEAQVAGQIEVEDYELASARLKWVQATTCLDLPEQREALDWHLATCEAARAALPGDAGRRTTSAGT
jgi:hypothetical protein